MKRTFHYEFEDQGEDGAVSIGTEPSLSERIRLEIDEQGDFWLSANKLGWQHLARVCAELGLGTFSDGFHFHVNENFMWSDGSPEFNFEVNDTLE